MSHLPVMDSAYPPSRETVEGQAMVLVAASMETSEEIAETMADWLEEADNFFPDVTDPADPDDAEELVARVIEEHNRVVTDTSEHAQALADVMATCYETGIYPAWCETENATDAWMDAHDIMGESLRGILVATHDDVTAMLTDQRLRVSVGALDEEHTESLVAEVAVLMRDRGLPVDDSRAAEGTLVLEPIRYEAVFAEIEIELDDEEDD